MSFNYGSQKRFPVYFSSHSIHIANKLKILNNSNCFNPQYLTQLENYFSNSVEPDKILLIKRFRRVLLNMLLCFLISLILDNLSLLNFFGDANRSRAMFQLMRLSISISLLFIEYLKVVLLLLLTWRIDVSLSIVCELLAKCKETIS